MLGDCGQRGTISGNKTRRLILRNPPSCAKIIAGDLIRQVWCDAKKQDTEIHEHATAFRHIVSCSKVLPLC
jgi:hypothetical protein